MYRSGTSFRAVGNNGYAGFCRGSGHPFGCEHLMDSHIHSVSFIYDHARLGIVLRRVSSFPERGVRPDALLRHMLHGLHTMADLYL